MILSESYRRRIVELAGLGKPQEKYAESIGLDPEQLSWMGAGDFGDAYETQDGRVIKVTSSKSEANIARQLIGDNGAHAEIYDVRDIGGGLFVVFQEMLNTDSGIEDKFYRLQSILDEQNLPIQYLGHLDPDELSEESRQEYDELQEFIDGIEDVNRVYRNLGIEASDIQPDNLGYDKNGVLKAFDLDDKRK